MDQWGGGYHIYIYIIHMCVYICAYCMSYLYTHRIEGPLYRSLYNEDHTILAYIKVYFWAPNFWKLPLFVQLT